MVRGGWSKIKRDGLEGEIQKEIMGEIGRAEHRIFEEKNTKMIS